MFSGKRTEPDIELAADSIRADSIRADSIRRVRDRANVAQAAVPSIRERYKSFPGREEVWRSPSIENR